MCALMKKSLKKIEQVFKKNPRFEFSIPLRDHSTSISFVKPSALLSGKI
jgi:hypothetical protein